MGGGWMEGGCWMEVDEGGGESCCGGGVAGWRAGGREGWMEGGWLDGGRGGWMEWGLLDGGLVASGLAGRRVDGKGLVDEGQRWIEGGWMEGWMEGWWMEA